MRNPRLFKLPAVRAGPIHPYHPLAWAPLAARSSFAAYLPKGAKG